MSLHRSLRLLAAIGVPLLALPGDDFNPKDCDGCEHKDEPDGGHCYMFKLPPLGRCGQRKPKPEKPEGT